MAKCPWCKIITQEGYITSTKYARCQSTLNPGNCKKGDISSTGTDWDRCVEGESGGVKFTQCPFYKKKVRRKKKTGQ